MSVLVDNTTGVLCQGFTGRQATFYSERAIAAGTRMLGGVTPGKGGSLHLGLPVFDSVQEGMAETRATASVIFVPPAHAGAAMIEAIEASMPLIVCVTERIPVLDMVRVRRALSGSQSVLVGPNCPGIVAPEKCRIGIMPVEVFMPGCVGIVSRSSTLTYEAVAQTTEVGLGQSTCIGIGADPVHGMGFIDAVKLFMEDADTRGIVVIGEIGGSEEEQLASYLADNTPAKPIVGYVAGQHAPSGRRMGHAGAVIQNGKGTAIEKINALSAAGVRISASPVQIGRTMAAALGA